MFINCGTANEEPKSTFKYSLSYIISVLVLQNWFHWPACQLLSHHFSAASVLRLLYWLCVGEAGTASSFCSGAHSREKARPEEEDSNSCLVCFLLRSPLLPIPRGTAPSKCHLRLWQRLPEAAGSGLELYPTLVEAAPPHYPSDTNTRQLVPLQSFKSISRLTSNFSFQSALLSFKLRKMLTFLLQFYEFWHILMQLLFQLKYK